MIDGNFIESLAEAIQAIEEVAGRDEAYGFAMDSLNKLAPGNATEEPIVEEV